jgi:transposase
MSRFSLEQKLEVVTYMKDGQHSLTEGAARFSLSRGEIQKWLAAYRYHGVAGLSKEHIGYPGEFKQLVIEDMRVCGMSYRETAAKHNVSDHKVIMKWERVYLEKGPEGLYVERRGRRNTLAVGQPKLAKQLEDDLISENQRLRAEVDYLKKLNALVQKKEQRGIKQK